MKPQETVNNLYYQTLGEKWYTVQDDPIALLRAESKLRNHWVKQKIQNHFNTKCPSILDIGCGAGFLTNELAKCGYQVTGLDLFPESLAVAKLKDSTNSVQYVQGDAYSLPFSEHSFDVVCMMDFLEHVENIKDIIREAARILKPNGLFFVHTFNRNVLSWLIVIKGVEWFIKNTPKNLHVYRLFIKPKELISICNDLELKKKEIVGLRPCFFTKSFFRMLLTGTIDNNFKFQFSKSLLTGYSGYFQK